MAILEPEVRTASNAAVTGLKRRLLTRREYRTIAEMGMFDGERVELIEGQIVHMAPIGNSHASVTHALANLLGAAFGPGTAARDQAPIALGFDRLPTELKPDISVVVGSSRDYLSRQATAPDIMLLVEVADSSLRDDRKTKAALYATAEIPEYWIVNLIEHRLEVHRIPGKGGYASVAHFSAADQVTPLLGTGFVTVSDFMP